MDDIKTKSKVQKVENNTTNNQRQEIVNHITLYDTINEFGASRTIECIVIDDETKEPIPFANVTFADNGINISG
ncbi:hypothetical protein HON01_12335, partial [Candidatus Woesearchaeota archaeon]|nr:hypothetical protein [Candidatus Woesearchaeota archaeon]